MSEKKTKTKTRTRRARKPSAANLSPQDAEHFQENMKDADEETKTEWLKRRAKEDAEAKKSNKVIETYYVKVGNKLVRKTVKSSGGCYSHYMGNFVKHPEILTDEVKANLKAE